MIPKIAHRTAETKDLSWEERKLWKRNENWLDIHWDKRFWDRSQRLDLLQTLLPQHADTLEAITRGVVMADLGRYACLYRFGGFYFDTDFKLVGSIDNLMSHKCILSLEEPYTGNIANIKSKIGNAVLASLPGYPLWHDFLIHVLTSHNIDEINSENPVFLTGPVALTEFFFLNHASYLDTHLLSSDVFFPRLKLFNLLYERTDNTRGVHLCWGSWRKKRGLSRINNLMRRKISCLY